MSAAKNYTVKLVQTEFVLVLSLVPTSLDNRGLTAVFFLLGSFLFYNESRSFHTNLVIMKAFYSIIIS